MLKIALKYFQNFGSFDCDYKCNFPLWIALPKPSLTSPRNGSGHFAIPKLMLPYEQPRTRFSGIFVPNNIPIWRSIPLSLEYASEFQHWNILKYSEIFWNIRLLTEYKQSNRVRPQFQVSINPTPATCCRVAQNMTQVYKLYNSGVWRIE